VVKIIQTQVIFILSVIILAIVASFFCSAYLLKAGSEVIEEIKQEDQEKETQDKITSMLKEIEENKKTKKYQEWHQNYIKTHPEYN
jgi:mannitol-specific phosphotransferase system IIBC component